MSVRPAPQPSALTAPYWEAAARGELLTQFCPRCERHFMYPRHWCPFCWFGEPVWVPVSGRATVIACSVVHQAPYEAFAALVPYVLAVVGLQEGPQLMCNVVGCDPELVAVGMEVEVVFEPRGEWRLPQFTPRAEDG